MTRASLWIRERSMNARATRRFLIPCLTGKYILPVKLSERAPVCRPADTKGPFADGQGGT